VAAAAPLRFALLLTLWLVLAGAAGKDLAPGIVAAALGCWVSLRLLPPARLAVRPLVLLGLLVRFPWQAVTAGLQVARLALDPRRKPQPAHVTWTPSLLPPGRARDAFLAYASLLPGTLPAGDTAQGAIVIHALTGAGTAAAAMAEEEARFARAFGLDD
jgi:multicomponent Na+:H+ antiporter subunit E